MFSPLLSHGFQLRSIEDLQTMQIVKILRYEKKVAAMFLLMIVSFLLCWTPYAVVSMMEAFGRQRVVSPVVAIVPSFLAKSSTAYNPLIYILMSKKVRSVVASFFLYTHNYLNYGFCYFLQAKMLLYLFASPLPSIMPSVSLSQGQWFQTLGSGPHLSAYRVAGDS